MLNAQHGKKDDLQHLQQLKPNAPWCWMAQCQDTPGVQLSPTTMGTTRSKSTYKGDTPWPFEATVHCFVRFQCKPLFTWQQFQVSSESAAQPLLHKVPIIGLHLQLQPTGNTSNRKPWVHCNPNATQVPECLVHDINSCNDSSTSRNIFDWRWWNPVLSTNEEHFQRCSDALFWAIWGQHYQVGIQRLRFVLSDGFERVIESQQNPCWGGIGWRNIHKYTISIHIPINLLNQSWIHISSSLIHWTGNTWRQRGIQCKLPLAQPANVFWLWNSLRSRHPHQICACKRCHLSRTRCIQVYLWP